MSARLSRGGLRVMSRLTVSPNARARQATSRQSSHGRQVQVIEPPQQVVGKVIRCQEVARPAEDVEAALTIGGNQRRVDRCGGPFCRYQQTCIDPFSLECVAQQPAKVVPANPAGDRGLPACISQQAGKGDRRVGSAAADDQFCILYKAVAAQRRQILHRRQDQITTDKTSR